METIPFIILHGWNLESKKFKPLTSLLSKKKFMVYCPDLPGFGLSEKPKSALYLDDYVHFVLDYMKKNKIIKANFICHSFGGRIGIKLAACYPEKINKLILTGAPGLVPVPRFKILFFLYLAKFGKLIFTLPLLSFFQSKAQKIIYRLANANDYYHTNVSMRESFQNVVRENLKEYLSLISAQTLLLWGINDSFVPVSIAHKMSKIIPGSKLVILDKSGHGLPFTHPELFLKNLLSFI